MISPQTMKMYRLREGLRFLEVCFRASHTVRKPNPMVNPAAKAATWVSDFETIVDMVMKGNALHLGAVEEWMKNWDGDGQTQRSSLEGLSPDRPGLYPWPLCL